MLHSPATVHAQRVVATLDMGAVTVRYADSVHQGAGSIAPSLQLDAPWGGATAAALYAQNGDGSWTTQGSAGISLFTPLLPGVRWLRAELSPYVGGSTHRDGTHTGEALLNGRLHLDQSSWGGWLGGGTGRTWDGISWRTLTMGDAGAWGRAGSAQLSATATPTSVREGGSTPINYTDVQGSLRWTLPLVTLNASLGTRLGDNLPTVPGDVTTWGNATAALWFVRFAALVVSAGSYPIDFTQGFPGGRYATVGLRLEARRGQRGESEGGDDLRRDGSVTYNAAHESGAATQFDTRDTTDGSGIRQRIFRVRNAHSARAEISGDFTNWQAVPLASGADGWWTIALPVATGVHQIALRLNGGSWTAPPGLTQLSDEFGGTVGLVVVP